MLHPLSLTAKPYGTRWRSRTGKAQLAYRFDIALQNEFSMQENRAQTFSWRLSERIIICPVPRNDSARWICTPPRR